MDIDALKRWIGRTSVVDDVIGNGCVAGLSATLDRRDTPPGMGQALPPPWQVAAGSER